MFHNDSHEISKNNLFFSHDKSWSAEGESSHEQFSQMILAASKEVSREGLANAR